MAVTYKIGGLNIIAINDIAPAGLQKLSEAMRQARQLVKKATETTVIALHVVRSARETGFDAEEAVSLLETSFFRHLIVHFRLQDPEDIFKALEGLTQKLQRLMTGLLSPDLRLAEYGYHWFRPASAVAYVQMPLSHALFGGPSVHGCLNKDPAGYHNPHDVNIRFSTLATVGNNTLTNTLIHECTHKYLATDDVCVSGLPFTVLADFEALYQDLGAPPQLGQLATLTPIQAINEAYVMTNYIQHMPDVDLRAAAAIKTAEIRIDRTIGPRDSNLRIFNSIGNDDL
ncbi:hypothetical protein [Pseudomonas sp. Marseille-P9899]|uniref:hypothetical protein n=1 Tax=Pseudomonas sp. Marseille-P9899 TaxID=2730401 RepID=UPI00158C02F5|nr:hypothetical protein [Pseudomonas sp. Marseille-P9899]